MAQAHGREVRPVPAACVKPFARGQKNDRAGAEAMMRPTMRLKAAQSAGTQGRASPIGLGPVAP